MKSIPLTQGHFAIVDDEDYVMVMQWKWRVRRDKNMLYAFRSERRNGRERSIFMHRVIAKARHGEVVDHKNRNALDNRKANLRLCTNQENSWNSHERGGSSVFKGVTYHKRRCKWQAQIRIDGRDRYLGLFENERDAACAYDAAAARLFGEYAYLNLPSTQCGLIAAA